MKTFLFKNDRLLRLRKQQVTFAELRVAKAAEEVAASKESVAQTLTQIDKLDQRIRSPNRTVQMHVHQVAIRLRTQLERFRVDLAHKQRRLSITVQELREAKRAAEMLMTLENRDKKKHVREMQKEEQAIIDEISTRKWIERDKIHV